jgi:iron complex transport system substrate-binding protein
MKKTRSLCLALAALLLLTLLSGCEKTPAKAPGEAGVIAVTDMMDRELQLAQPAEKIVVLTAADCEILFALGAGEQVVARGEYCNYPEEALALMEVASGSETNVEQIIALKPDLVMMSSMDQTLEQVSALEKAGIPVLMLAANTLDETYAAIALIGKVTGRDAEAEALVTGMKKELAALVDAVDGESGKSVYFEVSPLEYGLWTAGKGTFMDELAGMLGLENTFSDVNGWAEISQEQVIERNPDYIVTIFMAFDGAMDPVEEILARPGWAGITAVAKQQVKAVDSDEIARPGPRLVNAARDLYEIFYGDEA